MAQTRIDIGEADESILMYIVAKVHKHLLSNKNKQQFQLILDKLNLDSEPGMSTNMDNIGGELK